MELIAGVDESGRGPIAGPVVAAAVILPEGLTIEGVRDSKRVAEKKRETLYSEICDEALAVGVGIVHEDEIDRTNILAATRKAMRMALGRLKPQPDEALIDGYGLPDQIISNQGVIDGDEKVHVISAASIVAKVTRDRIMRDYHKVFPEYNFAQHKGYGTEEHMKNLREYLACPIHRKTFRPVSEHLPSLRLLKAHRLLGRWGERLAARELIHMGYRILEMNYRAAPYGEIDIVARNDDATVFIEVKTATQRKLGEPQDQIDDRKLSKLENAFEVYLSENEEPGEYRFDIMTVFFGKGRPQIRHFRDCLN